jgi:hypothetical protein
MWIATPTRWSGRSSPIPTSAPPAWSRSRGATAIAISAAIASRHATSTSRKTGSDQSLLIPAVRDELVQSPVVTVSGASASSAPMPPTRKVLRGGVVAGARRVSIPSAPEARIESPATTVSPTVPSSRASVGEVASAIAATRTSVPTTSRRPSTASRRARPPRRSSTAPATSSARPNASTGPHVSQMSSSKWRANAHAVSHDAVRK